MKQEKKPDIECLVCQKTFPFRKGKRFCSTTCRVQAFERRSMAFEYFDLVDNHIIKLLPNSKSKERIEGILEDVKNTRSALDYSFCLEWVKKKRRASMDDLKQKVNAIKSKLQKR